MTYDADNRLSTFNSTSVTVDADGNLTYGPGTNNTFGTYTYDARNELTSAGGLSYGYDPVGNRTSMTNGSTNTTFVINPQGSQMLMRIKGAITNYYIYGAGLLYEIDETATTTNAAFYHFDCRGSTVTLTDTNGNPTDIVQYSPYGTTTYRYGTNNTPFLYNGQFGVQTDPNGLLYMRARYYNPYISRFINADPSGFGGGLNFYAFCNDNPISMEDPFGLWAGLDDLAFTAGGAILGGAGSAISGLISGNFSWSKVGYGAVAGAAGGEATLYGGPIAGGIANGLANNLLNQSANMANGTQQNFSPAQLVGNGVVGGVTGYIGDAIPVPSISGFNAGQGSYEAVSSGILTKLENGTIQNISWTTAGKIFTTEMYNDIPTTALDGTVDILKELGQGESGGTIWQAPATSAPTGKPPP
jgi:RHS repeat-associated protein